MPTRQGRRTDLDPSLTPSFLWEKPLWRQGIARVAGVDEVGRGALAGCVAAAAVICPPHLEAALLEGVQDSKRLSRQKRQALLPLILQHCVAVGMGTASVREIDQLGIRQATALAMQRAVKQVDPVDHILVDGLRVAELGEHQTAIVKGDAQCLSIAAASIIAKVNRDRWMIRLDRRFPGYGWADNVGYGTAQHRQALLDLGLTQHHRRSFIHLAAEGID